MYFGVHFFFMDEVIAAKIKFPYILLYPKKT